MDYNAVQVNKPAVDPARRRLALLLSLCILTRAIVGISLALLRPGGFIGGDGAEYLDTARNIARGNGYAISFPRLWDPEFHEKTEGSDSYPKPEIFRPPLYSVSLVPWVAIFGDRLWPIALWNALLSTLAGWFLYELATRSLSRRVGDLGLLLYALYPLTLMLGAKIGAESLFLACLCATAWAVWRARESQPIIYSAVAGLCLGLATLTRSNAVFLWPLLVLWLLVYLRNYRLAAVWLTLAFAVTLLPWGIRNRVVTGHWIFLSASGPYNFWLGNNEVAYKMFTARHSKEYDRWGKELLGRLVPERVNQLPAGDFEASRQFWYREAWQFIRDDPLRWFRLIGAKCLEFWRPYVRPGFFSATYVWLSLATTLPLLVLGAWGLVRIFRIQPALGGLVLAIVLAGMSGLVLSHVHVRLRVPFVDAFFTVCAAQAVVSYWERRRKSA